VAFALQMWRACVEEAVVALEAGALPIGDISSLSGLGASEGTR